MDDDHDALLTGQTVEVGIGSDAVTVVGLNDLPIAQKALDGHGLVDRHALSGAGEPCDTIGGLYGFADVGPGPAVGVRFDLLTALGAAHTTNTGRRSGRRVVAAAWWAIT